MNEMIERVAKAIREVGLYDSDDYGISINDSKAIVKAVIEVMREPTDFMCSQGSLGRAADLETDGVWRAMIEAALKDDNT